MSAVQRLVGDVTSQVSAAASRCDGLLSTAADFVLKALGLASTSSSSSSRLFTRQALKFCLGWAAATCGGWLACRLRLLPHKVLYRAWFGGCMAAGFVSVMFVGVPVVAANRAGLLSDAGLHRFASYLAAYLCKWLCAMNPQLRVFGHYDRCTFDDIPKGAVYSVNHTSQFDGFVMFREPPARFFASVKFMGKASLRDLPMLGFLLFECLQYYRAYYTVQANSAHQTAEEYDSWGVDKERQKLEMDKVIQWIRDGNTFAYSPEGRVNRTPDVIQNPRHGMLRIFLETRKPIFVLTAWPTHEFWPVPSVLGGDPCEIDTTLAKYDYPEMPDGRELDAATFADSLQVFMQKELDALKARRAARIAAANK